MATKLYILLGNTWRECGQFDRVQLSKNWLKLCSYLRFKKSRQTSRLCVKWWEWPHKPKQCWSDESYHTVTAQVVLPIIVWWPTETTQRTNTMDSRWIILITILINRYFTARWPNRNLNTLQVSTEWWVLQRCQGNTILEAARNFFGNMFSN